MDGTLIDTEPLWGKATFELGELLGRPLTPEALSLLDGVAGDHNQIIATALDGLLGVRI